MTDRTMPGKCPSCRKGLVVVRLECPSCQAEVAGEFDPCPVCALDPEIRRLFDVFLAARGNVRRVQHVLGVSYPTARSRIEEMFRRLGGETTPGDPKDVLARVRSGELTVDEAERLLRGR